MSAQQIRWPSVPLLSQRQLPHKADLVRVGRSYDAPWARASSQSDQPASWLTSTARRCSQRWSEDLGSPCRRTGLAVHTPRPTATLGPVRCDARASSRLVIVAFSSSFRVVGVRSVGAPAVDGSVDPEVHHFRSSQLVRFLRILDRTHTSVCMMYARSGAQPGCDSRS